MAAESFDGFHAAADATMRLSKKNDMHPEVGFLHSLMRPEWSGTVADGARSARGSAGCNKIHQRRGVT